MPKLTRAVRHPGTREHCDSYDSKVIPADPLAVLAQGMYPADAALLTRSPPHRLASQADLAPCAPRPGQDTNLGCPSRIGDNLHYRDGSVTDMHGQAIGHRNVPHAAYKPLTRIFK